MATNSVLIPIVGSDSASPTEFTAASPSFNRYFTIPNTVIAWFGDYALPSGVPTPPNGITPNGFLRVEHHTHNQWETINYYSNLTGAQIATLLG
jgi:hypothetical protein